MPTPSPRESRSHFMDRCVPQLVNDEGMSPDQAVAVCTSLFEQDKSLDVTEVARTCTCADLKELDDESLVALCDAVGKELGEEIVKINEREEMAERRMSSRLTSTYVDDLLEAVEAELALLPESDIDPDAFPRFVAAVDAKRTEPRRLGMISTVAEGAGVFTLVSRRLTRSRMRQRGTRIASVSADLTQVDSRAVDALANLHNFWIGDFWGRHLGSRIAATVRQASLDRGLGRVEAGRIVRGMIRGTFPGVRVPGTFSGSPSQYFAGLAGTVRAHGSTFGALHSMVDAGVERYVFNAVIDQRTSEICAFLNGQTFTVRSAMSLESRMLRTEDPDEFKQVAGWRTVEQARAIAGEGDSASREAALSASGIQIPPLHFRCRSVIIPA